MKFSTFPLLAVGATICAISLAGCGGGGSSSGPSNPTPRPTATPVPTGVMVTVQLRDDAGTPVDGIVTLGTQRRATTGGSVTFSGVTPGAQTASAEVNGLVYNQNFTATLGANTVPIAINSSVSATPGTNPPAPPDFGAAQ